MYFYIPNGQIIIIKIRQLLLIHFCRQNIARSLKRSEFSKEDKISKLLLINKLLLVLCWKKCDHIE